MDPHIATFEVKLAGKKVPASTVVHEASNFHYFELEDNGAYITIPAIKYGDS